MNVGIITFHNAINYGAVLQTYALQTSLQNLNCDVHVINYINNKIVGKNEKPSLRDYRNPLKYLNDSYMYGIYQAKRKQIVRFSDRYIKKTSIVEKNNIQKIAEKFDVVFTGSDQVWNDKITGSDDTYYLNFIPGKKRFSYAASIGSNTIPTENIPRVKKLLADFNKISVRESSAVEALKTQLDISAVQVLDPTLLLTKNDYISLAEYPQEQEKFVLLYMLVYSETLLKSAKKKAEQLGISVFCINASGKRIKGVVDKSFVGIEEWIGLFLQAEFVFTNSFHGTVFSINFQCNFNVELPPAKINASSRITDVLKLFNLEDQLISNGQYNDKKVDFSIVETILAEERRESLDFLKQALNIAGFDNNNISKSILKIDASHCSGCGLCEKICPSNAIDMLEDNHGFMHPYISFSKCNQCGVCLVSCPYKKAEEEKSISKSPLNIYAAYSHDSEIVRNSSSGGIFYELAKCIIEEGGVVYGAAFGDDFTLEHRRIERIEDIKPLMQSKYMQSNAYKTFEFIKKDLEDKRRVLFVGTPCQIAALRRLYSKNEDMLILVDFVCHGVPSSKLIKDHISYVNRYFHSEVMEYFPRSKITGWKHNELFIFKNGKKDYLHPVTQAFKNIFHSSNDLRNSCYNCPFTTFNRSSDLTIGDYWGLEQKRPELFNEKGTSLILVNTQNGQNVLNKNHSLVLFPTSKDTILEEKQPHLFKPVKKPSTSTIFWEDYSQNGWAYVAEKYAECDRTNILKWRIKRILKRIRKG